MQNARTVGLIEELRAAFRNLPAYPEGTGHPDAEKSWQKYSRRLRELVLHDNPARFLQWDVIMYTMFIANTNIMEEELSYLVDKNEWESRWNEATKDDEFGAPLMPISYLRYTSTLIHHAYHLARFEDAMQLRANEFDLVFEFGGGYGSMCRLFKKLGFQGKYLIFDLPELSALQGFYLKGLGYDVEQHAVFPSSQRGIFCLSDFNDLRIQLAHTAPTARTLFIATWSLSESPLPLREKLLPVLEPFSAYLIAFQEKFFDIDNVAYFSAWQNELDIDFVKSWKIDFLPDSHYLMCKRSPSAPAQVSQISQLSKELQVC